MSNAPWPPIPRNDATIHAVACWRADSISLAHLRPMLGDLMALSMSTPCLRSGASPDTCIQYVPREEEWCVACRLHKITDQMRGQR